ncbi:GreA/GreB family elongation factor [Pseudomonas sp. CFBP 13719]|uniref:GreA/GreB family elongation factor n=1 Tax=Pseudomonas sp. CFBP 13719 TaxID=2775303 RepID=UPI00177F3A3F|nr:transcription elongation factor GreAB [Pseudomonas sp. CFBP 13719]MBD8683903.1 transcription elongation factor GreAB [Pseudomonas sp. CFBP 13719]
MNKPALLQAIIERLTIDLEVAQRAAQTAYETATHEENVAENKYDTLGLEASYLATGQARRMEEIRHGLAKFRALQLRDLQAGIELGALVALDSENGVRQWFFLGPDAAGLKLEFEGCPVMVITPRSPLGQSLLGKQVDDGVSMGGNAQVITEVI